MVGGLAIAVTVMYLLLLLHTVSQILVISPPSSFATPESTVSLRSGQVRVKVNVASSMLFEESADELDEVDLQVLTASHGADADQGYGRHLIVSIYGGETALPDATTTTTALIGSKHINSPQYKANSNKRRARLIFGSLFAIILSAIINVSGAIVYANNCKLNSD
jgi:hypothetical protein